MSRYVGRALWNTEQEQDAKEATNERSLPATALRPIEGSHEAIHAGSWTGVAEAPGLQAAMATS